jgi:hypothetical protein
MIAYGAEVERRIDPSVRRWRVEPNRYVCMCRASNRKTMRTW